MDCGGPGNFSAFLRCLLLTFNIFAGTLGYVMPPAVSGGDDVLCFRRFVCQMQN